MKILNEQERNKTRKKRLRKKLRVGEYTELCFEVDFAVKFVDRQHEEKMLDDFVDFVESQGLSCCGSTKVDLLTQTSTSSFVVADYKKCVEITTQDTFKQWLENNTVLLSVTVSNLKDVWHEYACE